MARYFALRLYFHSLTLWLVITNKPAHEIFLPYHTLTHVISICVYIYIYIYICDPLQENRAQCSVRKYREKIDRFLKNVLFQANRRERLGLL